MSQRDNLTSPTFHKDQQHLECWS